MTAFAGHALHLLKQFRKRSVTHEPVKYADISATGPLLVSGAAAFNVSSGWIIFGMLVLTARVSRSSFPGA